MNIKIQITGRPKIKQLDEFMNLWNESLQDITADNIRVGLSMPLGTIVLTEVDEELWSLKKEEMLQHIREEFGKKFNDVSLKVL